MNEGPFTIKSFHDYLAENKIMASRCRSCGRVNLPPRPICPDCHGRDLEWTQLGHLGAVRAYTIVRVPLSRMRDRCPYASGVIKMDDGPSISAQILDVRDEEQIKIGSRVEAEFIKEEEQTRLCFRLI